MSENNNLENLYEVVKTVRFGLKPSKVKNLSEFKPEIDKSKNYTFSDFRSNLQNILNNFEDLFFDSRVDKLSIKFKIKYNWLRVYTKNDFYNLKPDLKQEKSYDLTIIDYLYNELVRWQGAWKESIEKINILLSQPEESQKRRRDFALVLRKLQKRANFEFAEEFVKSIENTNIPYLDKQVTDLINLISETKEILIELTNQYLPAQTNGLQVAKASLNYYTLNKEPKQYSEEIENKKNTLKKPYYFKNWNYLDLLINLGFSEIEEYTNDRNKPDKRIKRVFLKNEVKILSIDDLYKHLKDWKAYIKSKFNEEIADFLGKYGEVYDKNFARALEIQNKYPIFETTNQQDFKDYLGHSWDIYRLGEEKKSIIDELNFQNGGGLEKYINDKESNNRELKPKEQDFKEISKQIKQKAQTRGNFFNLPGKNERVVTKKYKDVCELYKCIALKRGQILAEIIGLEYEKTDSQKLRYWSLILKENSNHFVVLIPRGSEDNHKKARDWIEKPNNFKLSQDENGRILYHFKSLTLRALEKLCFKTISDNTFKRQMRDNGVKVNFIIKQGNQVKEYYDYPFYKQVLHESELVEFYQQVLKKVVELTRRGVKTVDIIDFGNLHKVLNNPFDNLQQFEKELEINCYIKKPYILDDNQKQYLIENFEANIFEIASYDLEKERNNPERHTQIWQNFWSSGNQIQNYITRLNPEISIYYREADDELKNKIKSGEINFPSKLKEYQNRFKTEHFTLQTTITLNATHKKTDLAFKTTQDISEYVNRFNYDFNKDFKGNWFYGIDRGEKELATLFVGKFIKDKDGKSIVEPAKFSVWRLKKEYFEKEVDLKYGGKRTFKFYANPSLALQYFGDKAFESFEVEGAVDLTTAKLIGDKIVINGDVSSYIELTKLNAKKILNLAVQNKQNIDFIEVKEVNDSGIKLVIDNKRTKNFLYNYTNVFTGELETYGDLFNKKTDNISKIFSELSQFFNAINIHTELEKINHLIDGLSANIVGIINHLYKSKPGYIALENFDQFLEKKANERTDFEDLSTEEKITFMENNIEKNRLMLNRRLEWLIFRKFQAFVGVAQNIQNLTPKIKQSVFLRKEQIFRELDLDKQVYQFGNTIFINTHKTSSLCPNCLEFLNKSEKRVNNRVLCKHCEFDTDQDKNKQKHLYYLNDADKVAAYNVAKNAFDKIYTKK